MINGTLINYFFHCKRQCYLHGNRINLEDNSEIVKVGKALHEARHEGKDNTELKIDNIKIDKITKDYLIEIKKSDADIEAAKWQLIYYLKVLKNKGIERKGKLEVIEKNKAKNKVTIIELDQNLENELDKYILDVEHLISQDIVPKVINKNTCKKCSYYEYCYI